MVIEESLERGRRAMLQGSWEQARAEFSSVLAESPGHPYALRGLGDVLWWLGDASGCQQCMEKAYSVHREAGEGVEAATVAIWLAALQEKSLGNYAASNGWIATAERLVQQEGLQPLEGWTWWIRSGTSPDPAAARDWAQRALDRARETGDRDLELCALSDLGKALVGLGRAAEGLQLIDEAMAAAMGEESRNLDTVVATCCSMMGACDQAADLGRISQWCRAADRFMKTYGSPFLFADCRVRYGGVLLATGHWAEAERELSGVLGAVDPGTDYHAQAATRMATLRLRQGRLEEAEAMLAEVGDRAGGLLPAAALAHLRGRGELALRLLDRFHSGSQVDPVSRAQALDLQTSCLLSAGNLSRAREVVEVLAGLAERNLERIGAHHAFALGRLACALGESRADHQIERAMQLFAGCNLPFEAAQARLELARVLSHRPDVAIAEAQGAFSTFEKLGAVADADAAARLIRSLGGAARTGPRNVGVLTKREQEVLRLVGAGLSNPEIAERLFVSRKTVSHHVSSILSKLGLRNRSEAAIHSERYLG